MIFDFLITNIVKGKIRFLDYIFLRIFVVLFIQVFKTKAPDIDIKWTNILISKQNLFIYEN